ncbi:MAG: hypothetical protein KGP12_11495 [Actinomycetales bacterium]|nr:hypothetical protein [Actinomycetales bacterium]
MSSDSTQALTPASASPSAIRAGFVHVTPVLSEGIDLHWECRTVIHHDLDENPSTLEQRNGRLDRIGSHAEESGQPIDIFEPYTTGLHDEKTYRVVTDRGRWFNRVMGDDVDLSVAATDRASERIEFPNDLAESLTLDLAVYRRTIRRVVSTSVGNGPFQS